MSQQSISLTLQPPVKLRQWRLRLLVSSFASLPSHSVFWHESHVNGVPHFSALTRKKELLEEPFNESEEDFDMEMDEYFWEDQKWRQNDVKCLRISSTFSALPTVASHPPVPLLHFFEWPVFFVFVWISQMAINVWSFFQIGSSASASLLKCLKWSFESNTKNTKVGSVEEISWGKTLAALRKPHILTSSCGRGFYHTHTLARKQLPHINARLF